ncbi:MAG: hypothetical protein LBE36_10045, partial [Flavobacteriaceae bacterium]|nr:hypothetical protein [Flavobacteriaceae bacterium]
MLKQLTIIGNATPEIGVQHQYSLMDFMLSYDDPHFPENPETEWNIHVLEDGEWRKTTGSAKYGDVVYYTFTQKSLTRKGIKLIATQGENTGELILKPKSAGTPKIVRIELLDINGEPPTNPMNYTDTLIARAYCTDMEAQTLYFTLWEDDAEGAGHNSINKNINTLPVPAMVKKGVAEARFNMATYTMASIIANMQIAKGDKNEGKNHEYYVTAEYLGKLEAGNNVNIANPAYRPNAEDLPKLPNRNPTPTPAPKKDTYKTNLTSGSKTKAPDPKGKIVKVSFVDEKGNPVFDLKGIKNIIANIETKNMVGKTIKLTIWEDDTFSNDAVWSEVVKIEKDIYRASIPVKDIWEKGSKYELGDGSTQEYFIEVEYAGEELKSGVITVDKDAPRTKPNSGNSVVKVEGAEKEKKEEEK